jgi:predicted Zn-dependent protease
LDYNSAFQQWVAGTIKEIEDSVQLLGVGDFGQAKEKLAGVVAGRPDVPALYYLMAVADFQLGNVREAKQLVQMFLRRNPLNQEGIRLLNAIQLGS